MKTNGRVGTSTTARCVIKKNCICLLAQCQLIAKKKRNDKLVQFNCSLPLPLQENYLLEHEKSKTGFTEYEMWQMIYSSSKLLFCKGSKIEVTYS